MTGDVTMLDFVGREREDKLQSLSALIGNTPVIKILARCEGQDVTVYAKAEMYNLSGSIKDRMALAILQDAMQRGDLLPGQTIVEATSGNSGISFAAIGCALGHPEHRRPPGRAYRITHPFGRPQMRPAPGTGPFG